MGRQLGDLVTEPIRFRNAVFIGSPLRLRRLYTAIFESPRALQDTRSLGNR